MKLSTCCGVEVTDLLMLDYGICPECKEHCEFEDQEEEDEDCPECDGRGCNECVIILSDD